MACDLWATKSGKGLRQQPMNTDVCAYRAHYRGILSSSSPAEISAWGCSACGRTSSPGSDTASATSQISVWSKFKKKISIIQLPGNYLNITHHRNKKHLLWQTLLFQKAAFGTSWKLPHSQRGLLFPLLASPVRMDTGETEDWIFRIGNVRFR